MHENFGAQLRRRREEIGIALDAIAEQTKIKLSLLEALERNDVSRWPSGLFRRAYLRAYAQIIGLDPDATVREFLAAHPDPAYPVETVPSVLNGTASTSGPPTRLRYIVGSALSRFRRTSTIDEAPAPARVAAPLPLPALASIEAPQEIAAVAPPSPGLDLMAVARLCTEFGRIETANDILPLLQDAAGILGASGIIVWVWDEPTAALQPALVHGYADKVVAQFPAVTRDADNATAAAFRSAQPAEMSGALVVPLLTAGGCSGVLAIEMASGADLAADVRAVASIFGAMFARLIEGNASEAFELHHAAGA